MIPMYTPVGRMCRHTRASGFKIAIVVGYTNAIGKIRVRYWRAASKRWTGPTLVELDHLAPFGERDHANGKRSRTIKCAVEHAPMKVSF